MPKLKNVKECRVPKINVFIFKGMVPIRVRYMLKLPVLNSLVVIGHNKLTQIFTQCHMTLKARHENWTPMRVEINSLGKHL